MAQLDATSDGLTRAESVAERADAYRVALQLLRERVWRDDPTPDDALALAAYLTREMMPE